ncbi:MAG TPA: NosD domain-containing protein [Candidatus Angelobacter sp.]|nr:NosD domain-containing protein [Candidatus Angelobacter sp.]
MSRLIVLASMIVLVPMITGFSHPVFAETFTNRPSILITGNDGFTADNGVTAGSGTSNDPYVLSGWSIEVPVGGYGIEIANTTAYFVVSDDQIVQVQTSCGANCGDGILLFSIENGQVQNTNINVLGYGIRINTSDNFLVDNSNVNSREQGYGVWVENSNNFQITGNSIQSGAGAVMFLNMVDSFDISYNNLQGGPFALDGANLSDGTIVGNTGGAEDGIGLGNIAHLLISNNNVRGHFSIAVGGCGDVTIDSNNATAVDSGILVSRCTNVLVSNNAASKIFGPGVWVTSSNNITVNSNILSSNADGIRLTDSATGNTITSNTISNNQCGIQTSTADQNNIADNIFAGNTQDFCSF